MSGRLGSRYEDYLFHRVKLDPQPASRPSGTSGYFSKPSKNLDPRLFNGQKLKPEVRTELLNRLYDFWGQRYNSPERWSTVWIAGSGISYQWAEDRGGIGDLDVLIGVNHTLFYELNPDFRGMPERDVDDRWNREFDDTLEAEMKTWRGFETTFYVNPGASDIRLIHPYAAYNVSADEWTVHPISLPEDWNPQTYFPKAWWSQIWAEQQTAQDLIDGYHRNREAMLAAVPNSPAWLNAADHLQWYVRAATDLFKTIHDDRKKAFNRDGAGYKDYYNFRWQAHKKAGITDALHRIATVHKNARIEQQEALYGKPIIPAKDALTQASLAGTKYERDSIQVPRIAE